MKTLIKTILLASSTALLFACGSSSGGDLNEGGTDGTTPVDGGHDSSKPEDSGHDSGNPSDTGMKDSGTPKPPTINLTKQIDRMGRPGINTVMNDSFFPTGTGSPPTTPLKDAYNQNSSPSTWKTYASSLGTGSPGFVGPMAVVDSLDTVCGNQLLNDDEAMGTPADYGTLAGVLADDELYVNTGNTTCTAYLGVEADYLGTALKIPPLNNTDCGGRGLGYDVINITYTVLAVGLPKKPTIPIKAAVSDGTTAVAAKTGGTTFPYLAAPM